MMGTDWIARHGQVTEDSLSRASLDTNSIAADFVEDVFRDVNRHVGRDRQGDRVAGTTVDLDQLAEWDHLEPGDDPEAVA